MDADRVVQRVARQFDDIAAFEAMFGVEFDDSERADMAAQLARAEAIGDQWRNPRDLIRDVYQDAINSVAEWSISGVSHPTGTLQFHRRLPDGVVDTARLLAAKQGRLASCHRLLGGPVLPRSYIEAAAQLVSRTVGTPKNLVHLWFNNLLALEMDAVIAATAAVQITDESDSSTAQPIAGEPAGRGGDGGGNHQWLNRNKAWEEYVAREVDSIGSKTTFYRVVEDPNRRGCLIVDAQFRIREDSIRRFVHVEKLNQASRERAENPPASRKLAGKISG